jgi:probable HAF family extracellular repeat protein
MGSLSRTVMGALSAVVLLCLLLIVGVRVSSAPAAPYLITDLGTLSAGSYSLAHAINGAALSQVVGRSVARVTETVTYYDVDPVTGEPIGDPKMTTVTNDFEHAFRWPDANGGMADLGTLPGGETSAAHGINGYGHVVGTSATSTGENHAVRWSPEGVIADLGTLGASPAEARGINDSGRAVGFSATPSGQTRAFRTAAYSPIAPLTDDLGTLPGGAFSFAYAINNAGITVGSSTVRVGTSIQEHAVKWTDTAIIDLGTLAGHNKSVAFGINGLGQIVGYSLVIGGAQRAVRWSATGAITNLGTLPRGTRSVAYAVNDAGTTVGSATNSSGVWRAVRWTSSGITDLNTLIDSSLRSEWDLREARSINGAEEIVGWGYHNGQQRAFRLQRR